MRLQLLSLLIVSIFLTQAASSATYPDINPCSLISLQKIYTAYPTIKTMEEQTIGPNTTCNYHNKYGLSELIVSVHKNDGATAKSVVSMLWVTAIESKQLRAWGKRLQWPFPFQNLNTGLPVTWWLSCISKRLTSA